MMKTAKALHLIGLAMFLGSVFGHITVGFIPAVEDPAGLLFGRQAIGIATWALTIPGLALLAATGLFMALRRGPGVFRSGWLAVHLVIGVLIILNAALILVPTGGALLDTATAVAGGTVTPEAMRSGAGRESLFGAINVALALTTVFLAVSKPRLGPGLDRSDR